MKRPFSNPSGMSWAEDLFKARPVGNLLVAKEESKFSKASFLRVYRNNRKEFWRIKENTPPLVKIHGSQS